MIDEAINQAPENMRELIQALRALRRVAKVGAVTIAAEVGSLTRFQHPRQLMGCSGAVSCENPSGSKIR
ncbi:MAG TPA: transposase [Spirochaetia bacterium]|nr:transposase [Spirochaetia bacterium]